MTKSEATVEVFWTAFQRLPRGAKQSILQRVVENSRLRRDLMDLAVIESRRNEPARPLRDYLHEQRRRR